MDRRAVRTSLLLVGARHAHAPPVSAPPRGGRRRPVGAGRPPARRWLARRRAPLLPRTAQPAAAHRPRDGSRGRLGPRGRARERRPRGGGAVVPRRTPSSGARGDRRPRGCGCGPSLSGHRAHAGPDPPRPDRPRSRLGGSPATLAGVPAGGRGRAGARGRRHRVRRQPGHPDPHGGCLCGRRARPDRDHRAGQPSEGVRGQPRHGADHSGPGVRRRGLGSCGPGGRWLHDLRRRPGGGDAVPERRAGIRAHRGGRRLRGRRGGRRVAERPDAGLDPDEGTGRLAQRRRVRRRPALRSAGPGGGSRPGPDRPGDPGRAGSPGCGRTALGKPPARAGVSGAAPWRLRSP